ncbi:hypothetical protein NDU88_003077 [Pleurodeles waltl]|uniref:Uncharacterized protein n=1 Tax=Pleurodeles waltl TaxID=8319 RepID=A0AAV7RC59_PLEWA|nr:hypothetical protein NDU88_003077 [Pleurodeles waltl]
MQKRIDPSGFGTITTGEHNRLEEGSITFTLMFLTSLPVPTAPLSNPFPHLSILSPPAALFPFEQLAISQKGPYLGEPRPSWDVAHSECVLPRFLVPEAFRCLHAVRILRFRPGLLLVVPLGIRGSDQLQVSRVRLPRRLLPSVFSF